MNHFQPRPYVPYQIDFTSLTTGKVVRQSKRRVTFKFGFANLPALAQGRTGVDCRGSEHEVTLVWSFASGKRQILFDNKQIHYGVSEGSDFNHAFSMPGKEGYSHKMRIRNVGKRFDMSLDGVSFFDFPKMYTLGNADMKRDYADVIEASPPPPTLGWGGEIVAVEEGGRRGRVVPTRTNPAYANDSATSAEEEREMVAMAKLASIRELEKKTGSEQKGKTVQDVATTREEEKRLVAMAKLNSMRDLKVQKEQKGKESQAIVPAGQAPTSGAPLAPVGEETSLLDFGVPSSVTINQGSGDDVADDVTTHSFVVAPQTHDPSRQQQSAQLGATNAYNGAPGLPGAGVVHNAPPPPTWNETNAAFGYQPQPPPAAYGTSPPASNPALAFNNNTWAAAAPASAAPSSHTSPYGALPLAPQPAQPNYQPSNGTFPSSAQQGQSSYQPSLNPSTPPKTSTQGPIGQVPDLGFASPTTAAVNFDTSSAPGASAPPSVQAKKEGDELAVALDSLVNLHDIRSGPEQNPFGEAKLTMNPTPIQNQSNGKSQGLPPSSVGMRPQTLEEMRAAKPAAVAQPAYAQPSYAQPPAYQPYPQQQLAQQQQANAYGNYQLPPGQLGHAAPSQTAFAYQ